MRVKLKKKLQILLASVRAPEVVRIVNDSVTLRAFFDIDALAAIENEVTVCNFRVIDYRSPLKSKQRLGALDSSIALNAPTTRKISAQAGKGVTLAQGNVDITKSIPNDGIKRVLRGEGARNSKVIRLADRGEDEFVEMASAEPSIESQITRPVATLLSLRRDLIHLDSRDPAAEVNAVSFQKRIEAPIRGFREVDDLSKLNMKQRSFRKSLKNTAGSASLVKIEDNAEQTLEIFCTFTLPKSSLKRCVFEVDALKGISPAAKALQTLSFDVDLREAFEKFIIPTRPPAVEIASIGSARTIRATQRDRNARSMRVYRRVIETTEFDDSTFSMIADIPASFGESIRFIDHPTTAGKCIYRVVPFNELAATSGEFSGAVTRGARQVRNDAHPDTTAILATEDADGVRIRVFSVPDDVVSLKLLRRSLTIHEKDYSAPITIQGDSLKQMDRQLTFMEFRDRPSRANAIYEYAVETVDVRGNVRRSLKSSITRFVGDRSTYGSYNLTTSDASTFLNPTPKISFQIEAPNDEASLNTLYNILVTAGLDSQYVDEIKQNRELFGKVVGIEMLRFDTVTGLNESFGLIQAGVFEDSSKSRSSKNVSAPVGGRTYIYQYRLLLRASSTMFDSAVVSNTDLETGRSYSTKMKKFNSPNVFSRGTLASTASQLNVLSKTGVKQSVDNTSEGLMSQGATSLVGEIQVTMPDNETSLGRLRAEAASRGNIVSWKVTQGTQPIDHIVVYAEYNGIIAPLRAVHYSNQQNMIYVDDRLAAPLGNISYYVKPVFTNFNEGPLVGPAEI